MLSFGAADDVIRLRRQIHKKPRVSTLGSLLNQPTTRAARRYDRSENGRPHEDS